MPASSPLPVACSTAVGAALDLVAMVGWKTEKRDVSEGKVRWFVHKGLHGKIRPDA